MKRTIPRCVFTNDGECDDMNALVHLLLCANDIDIEGIVLTSSMYHWAGDAVAHIEPYRWAGASWMWDYLDAYEEVQENLKVHDARFPTADELRAVTCVGNVRYAGDMENDTPGSELIREAILKDDPRHLYLLAGGGTNTIARALARIEEDWKDSERWQEIYQRIAVNTTIYMIVTQDDTYRDYIVGHWPGIRLLHATDICGVAFLYDETNLPAEACALYKGSWMKPHLLDKGPLMARYHTWADGHVYPGEQEQSQFGSNAALAGGSWWGGRPHKRYDMISEGDSPSFLHLIGKGLLNRSDPTFGGWGGRFERKEVHEFSEAERIAGTVCDYWGMATDAATAPMCGEDFQLTRWVQDWMHDFASRASWCVAERFEDANHAPDVTIAEGYDLWVRAGETVTLHAITEDPDGDDVRVSWFRYAEADECDEEVELVCDGAMCSLTVPEEAYREDTIHIVCRASDEGNGRDECLVSYARVIIVVV